MCTSLCNICQANIYLHSSKGMMRYDYGKIITHGCKLHM